MTIVVNLWGGPGCGKSTWVSFLFQELKQRGFKAEIVTEFAKELVYEGRLKELKSNWPLILGEQLKRMSRLVDKVDVIITDSPLALSAVYANLNDSSKYPFDLLGEIQNLEKKFGLDRSFDIRVIRTKSYKKYGRTQSRAQAVELDNAIHRMLAYSTNPDGDDLACFTEVYSDPNKEYKDSLERLFNSIKIMVDYEKEEKRYRGSE